MKKILFIVAHPDDETISAGGTIARHISEKDKVYCYSFTDGVGSRGPSESEKKKRLKSALKASKILGFKWIDLGKNVFEDNSLDTYPLLTFVKIIEKIKKRVNPQVIYTHSQYDLNVDHRIISVATSTAFRPQTNEKWEKILSFEVPSSTDFSNEVNDSFKPNYFVNVKKFWKLKMKALKAYRQEIRPRPHSRSFDGIENLAKIRGNQSGQSFTESFQMLREIKR
jgi:LmbE family N-acetylglucosaminyl deacetylase